MNKRLPLFILLGLVLPALAQYGMPTQPEPPLDKESIQQSLNFYCNQNVNKIPANILECLRLLEQDGNNSTTPPLPDSPFLELKRVTRFIDGSQNDNQNGTFPDHGKTNVDLIRTLPANYQDGRSVPVADLPNPRIVSNRVVRSRTGNLQPSLLGMNLLFVIFGQFTDHDIDLTPGQSGDGHETIEITIPICDTQFDPDCTGTETFTQERSVFNAAKTVRTPTNVITAWIDGSQIYGSDLTVASSLRLFRDGKFRIPRGFLLKSSTQFIAGDVRANQNLILTSLHTVFAREHNRLCDRIISEIGAGQCTDEEVYHIARHYVIGLLQKITYDDWLPKLLGPRQTNLFLGDYEGHKADVSPDILIEFSTAAFRFGHAMIRTPFTLIRQTRDISRTYNAGEVFFNPALLFESSMRRILRSSVLTLAKERSLILSEELRSLLVLLHQDRSVKFDLFTLNLNRGRDHGLAYANDYREAYDLNRRDTFEKLIENPAHAALLEELYGDVDKVELFVAILGEPANRNANIGRLGARIVARQFKNIRDADALWYENWFPQALIDEIKGTTLIDIIQRNVNNLDDIAREPSFFAQM